jgi:uncharacterized membrane-anchored protein
LQQSQAQLSQSQSSAFADPLRQINWISGPQTISIGDIASVNIPDGYRFAAAQAGARVILNNANTPVPNDLVGILADKGGTWYAVLEYNKSGYVKSADVSQIDSASVLKAVQKQLQNKDITWQSQPAFDAQADSLAWSAQVSAGSAKTLNEGVALFGRHGILEVTDVRAFPLAAAPALSQIVSKNVTFKAGERYTDYQNGDKAGEVAVAGLIAGNNSDNRTTGAAGWVYWVYSGLGVCVASAGFLVLGSRKKGRQHRPVQAVAPTSVAAQAASATKPVVAPAPSTAKAAVALTNVNLNGNGHSKSNGNGSPSQRNGKHFHRNRRKRVFNYPKFYTHVMKELSFHAYDASPSTANGKSRNGHANGHTNGHANGNGTNGHVNGANGANGSDTNGSLKSGIEELISTQKALIQEQKCLLEQQTRLIEEKRWLIEEQTAFLKGQAGIINDQQFPLKFE